MLLSVLVRKKLYKRANKETAIITITIIINGFGSLDTTIL